MSSRRGAGQLRVVVPYSAQNATVRTRALHWLERAAVARGTTVDDIAEMVGPGFSSKRRIDSTPTLLLRNARRFTRGRFEARLLRAARPGIYDLDDGLPWDDGTLPQLGRIWKRPWPRSLLAERCARAADRVIAGNAVLADWASTHCADVTMIPTCVEPADYRAKERYELADPPVLGWIGSPATEHYLAAITPALAEIQRRHGALVEVVSSGAALAPALAAVATTEPWSLAAAADIGRRWDIGLMPLSDGVYERAKCGYKLLQYAAAGLPAIGSPVGVNRELLTELGSPAPTTVDEWVDALDVLLTESASARAARGRAGRALAQRFSYDAWEPTWLAATGLGPAVSGP